MLLWRFVKLKWFDVVGRVHVERFDVFQRFLVKELSWATRYKGTLKVVYLSTIPLPNFFNKGCESRLQ